MFPKRPVERPTAGRPAPSHTCLSPLQSATMDRTSMRKSSAVPLTLLAVAALATGCHDRPVSRNCVDAQGRIVPDTNCNTGTGGGGGMGYHYIYGVSSGGRVGDAV